MYNKTLEDQLSLFIASLRKTLSVSTKLFMSALHWIMKLSSIQPIRGVRITVICRRLSKKRKKINKILRLHDKTENSC